MKKLFLEFITLALLVICTTSLPVAATEPNPSGTCGKDVSWVLDSDGILTISGSGSMYIDEHDVAPWFELRDSIRKVVIEDGVTSIDVLAFYRCSNLTSVTISDSVVQIGGEAFAKCTSLTQITIPNSVTEIAFGSFYGCSSLTTVILPESISSIGCDAFSDCNNLWHVLYKGTKSSWNTLEINVNGNTPLVDATIHYNAVGDEVDPVNKVCTICTSSTTKPTETTVSTRPTEITLTRPAPTETTVPVTPTEPTDSNDPADSDESTTDPAVWMIVAVAAVLISGIVIDILRKKKH